jgi:DnaK suppressor protein
VVGGWLEVEVKSSEVQRLERYLRFHLMEILEHLNSDSDRDTVWSVRWGASATVLKEYWLRSHDDITTALARIEEGTYGNCVGCGQEIDQRRLEVVPWSKFCNFCEEESDQSPRAHDELINRSQCSSTGSQKLSS